MWYWGMVVAGILFLFLWGFLRSSFRSAYAKPIIGPLYWKTVENMFDFRPQARCFPGFVDIIAKALWLLILFCLVYLIAVFNESFFAIAAVSVFDLMLIKNILTARKATRAFNDEARALEEEETKTFVKHKLFAPCVWAYRAYMAYVVVLFLLVTAAHLAIDVPGVQEPPPPSPTPTIFPRPTPPPKPDYSSLNDGLYFDPLKQGDSGEMVKDVQRILIGAGYLKDVADGVYGAKTQAAIEAFQAKHLPYEDSYATPKTLAYLFFGPGLEEFRETYLYSDVSSEGILSVWISTVAGSKFHRKENCTGLSAAAAKKLVTMNYANANNYKPCAICYN